MMTRLGLLLLSASCVLARASVPPTLPHGHPGAHEQLHFSTVKEVIESMERMWNNYTAIHTRNVELEKQISVAEERLAVSSQLCNVEKRALLQVQDLRVSSLERQLAAEKATHAGTTSTDDEGPGSFGRDGIHGGSSARVCKCELAACHEARAGVSELAHHILKRFEGIWMDEEMEKVPANERAVLTRSSVIWAKDELSKKSQDGGKGDCNVTDSATHRRIDQSDVTAQNSTLESTIVEKENITAPSSAGHTAVEKGTMYAFSEIQVSWHEAMSECKKFGLRLVSVQTAAKGDLLHEAWQGGKRPHSEYWVSGRGMGGDEDFVWESAGESFTHTRWHAGHLEPRPHGHHCVAVSFHGAHWLKLDCSQIRAFVCEP